jgi:hypothetical protein
MSTTALARFVVVPAMGLLLLACGDDHAHGSGGGGGGDSARPTCDELSEVCHDTTSDLGVECHELGHESSTTEATCKEREAECKAECQ